MPIKFRHPGDPSQNTDEPSGLQRLLAGGVRAASGWAASVPAMELGVGSLIGAGIAGAGETAAEAIEGSDINSKRIAVEAALGAVPLGKVFTGLRGQSAIRSAALSGAGEAGRELADNEGLHPGRIATSAGLGGAFGALLGGWGGPKGEPKATPSPYEVEPTAVAGGQVLKPGGKGIVFTRKPSSIRPSESPRWDTPSNTQGIAGLGLEPEPDYAPTPIHGDGGYQVGGALKSKARAGKDAVAAARAEVFATGMRDKEKQAELAANRIADAIAEGRLQPGATTVSESGSIDTPEGKARFNQRWTPPKDEEEDLDVFDQPGPKPRKGGGGGNGPKPPKPQLPIAEPYSGGAGAEVSMLDPSEMPRPDPYSGGLGLSLEDEVSPLAEALGAKQPKTPTLKQKAQEESYGALLAKLQGEGRGAAPEVPGPPVEAPEALPEAPTVHPQPTYEEAQEQFRQRFKKEPSALFKAQKARAQAEQDEFVEPVRRSLEEEADRRIADQRQGLILPEAFKPFLEDPPRINEQDLDTLKGIPTQAAPEVAEEVQSPLAKLFKSRVDAAGQGYRDIKAALAGGEKVPEEGRAAAGMALRREGQAAGLPIGKAAQQQPVTPSTEGAPQAVRAEFIGEQEGVGPLFNIVGGAEHGNTVDLAGLQQRGIPEPSGIDSETLNGLSDAWKKKFGSETGSISPDFLARLATGGLGALGGGIVGGAAGHPFIGAAVGGAAGLAGPAAISGVLKSFGAPPETVAAIESGTATPEAVATTTHNLMEALPQIQRTNLLMSVRNLPANVWFGPWGSAFMEGIERWASGDPAGAEILSRLHPAKFASRVNANMGAARQRIAEGELGRVEGNNPLLAGYNNWLQFPGVAMTAGDMSSQQILAESGIPEEVARQITLTSEPELGAAKKLANLGKGSPLMQLLLPFARTTANIAEQGAHRTPGLGFLTQSMRETPDPLKLQMIQQGLGLGAGGIGYVAGNSLDPEQAKYVRPYMSNVAGRYSLPASVGFTAGQAAHAGRSPFGAQTMMEIPNSLPLPSTAPIAEWVRAAEGGKPPRGVIPSALRELLDYFGIGGN